MLKVRFYKAKRFKGMKTSLRKYLGLQPGVLLSLPSMTAQLSSYLTKKLTRYLSPEPNLLTKLSSFP